MPLPNALTPVENDTTTYRDLARSATDSITCPACNHREVEWATDNRTRDTETTPGGVQRWWLRCERESCSVEFYSYRIRNTFDPADSRARYPYYIANVAIRNAIPIAQIPECPRCGLPIGTEQRRSSEDSEIVINFKNGHSLVKDQMKQKTGMVFIISCSSFGESKFLLKRSKGAKYAIYRSNKKDDAKIEEAGLVWEFEGNHAIEYDLTDRIAESLVIGLEIELDYRSSSVSRATLTSTFGVDAGSDYHHIPLCSVCGAPECWNHIPHNMIKALTRDSSIQGLEFIIYGSKINSEEFAKRLPIDSIKKYFKATESDGLHLHLLMPHDMEAIPITIVKNFWQLFRFHYPAWVYLFGNYSKEQGYLRQNRYARFGRFRVSPFTAKWITEANGAGSHQEGGLNVSNVKSNAGVVTHLDIEVRTNDSTIDIEQIVAARALTKAIFLRATQLATYGLINMAKGAKAPVWEKITTIIDKLNIPLTENNERKCDITHSDESFIQENCESLIKEVSPFLSDFERKCIRSLISNPVRDRRDITEVSRILPAPLSSKAQTLKKLITLTSIEASNEEGWISQVSGILSETPDEIRKSMTELKAIFDEDTKRVITRRVT